MSDPFAGLPKGHYGAILADPPWTFPRWDKKPMPPNTDGIVAYQTMPMEWIATLPVADLAAKDCVLFMWGMWAMLRETLDTMDQWGFPFKSCAFVWMKAAANQIEMFRDDTDAYCGMGYWTRSSSEPCLLGSRGKPKRLNANVRQGIIAPRREHSRKPDGVHERIERLVAGPYLELFARQRRPGWDCWGNETTKFNTPTDDYDASKDFAGSLDEGYRAIRERMANGGPGWNPKP